ncbi:hypothetical protein HYH03_018291 [Edaphochlamys debaryana]|uniref:Uncharacterized protein n=1 Tax=Edaphochlamys debaryana TaxID=47281 RepID=A0A836BN28_9CHLO|nr:hypothetical protein HYH03_018291 [Edaphochlamys debaryana]|eukprot:KAG2482801.1 hypothetical protein HYH03_018291 [Edaphochlamys debaryana]
MDAERSRVDRCGNLVAMLVAPSELAVLDGHVTAEALGRAIDTVPKTEVQAAIGEVLESLERRIEADPGPTVDRILDMAELAARKHLFQKLLLMFLVVGVPPKQLRGLDPGVMLGGLMLLAATPVPVVAAVAALLAPLAAAVRTGKASGSAEQHSRQVA